jgi:chorismate mutase
MHSGPEVRAVDRAARVMENAVSRAEKAGASGPVVRRIYEAVIEAHIDFELKLHRGTAQPATGD